MWFFLKLENFEECLDSIELSFEFIELHLKEKQFQFIREEGTAQEASDAIEEFNQRFKEAGIGYEFLLGDTIRIDSKYIHNEVVKPVLSILQENKLLKGVMDEFLPAHSHYRNQRYKEVLVDCLKSFESTMKEIWGKYGWEFR